MTTMKLVIVGVFLALGGIQLADCIKCIWSGHFVPFFSKYKSDSMNGVDTHCPTITKCKVDYDDPGFGFGEVGLTYGCGACPRTKYCKDCTGDYCNKASVLNLINDLERELVPCLRYTKLSKESKPPPPVETFCRPLDKCFKFFTRKPLAQHIQANATIIGCESSMNFSYSDVTGFERYECRPNAEKTDCIKLHHITNAWHPNWLLVAVLLGCTMLIAMLIALLIALFIRRYSFLALL